MFFVVIIFGDGAELEFGQRTCVAGAYDGDLTAGCGGGCGGWFGGWCYGCHVYMNAIDNDFTLTSIPLLLTPNI